MKTILVFLVFIFTDLYADDISKDIERFKTKGFNEIKYLQNNIIEIKDKQTGQVKYVDITDHSGEIITKTSEMQIFDLPAIPDSIFEYKYTYQTKLLVAGAMGTPLSIGDFDNNGKLDFAGTYKVIQDYEIGQVGVVEQTSDSTFELVKLFDYADSATICVGVTDVDNDGRIELNNRRAQEFYNYEALSPDSLPGEFSFSHSMWQMSGMVSSETFTDMDNDNIMDVVYVGDDTLDPWANKMYVAEYKEDVNNFVQIFRFPPPCWTVSGISVGDFDGDGFKEFATGSIYGDVYVVENTGDDSYKHIFSDTIDTPNAYLTCATNDIDFNGKTEFFLGGSSYYNGLSGTRIYWFEADGDNSYQKMRSIFLNGTGVLGTTELYSYDVNADSVDDLVFAFENYVVILIWNNEAKQFDLHYLDYINLGYSEIQSVNIFDINRDDQADILISIEDFWNKPRVSTFIFKNNFLTSISNKKKSLISKPYLINNYPNPFNNSTRIQISIPNPDTIDLTIFDVTGKEVANLIDNKKYSKGVYSIHWNAQDNHRREVSTGLYFAVFKTKNTKVVKKLLYVK